MSLTNINTPIQNIRTPVKIPSTPRKVNKKNKYDNTCYSHITKNLYNKFQEY